MRGSRITAMVITFMILGGCEHLLAGRIPTGAAFALAAPLIADPGHSRSSLIVALLAAATMLVARLTTAPDVGTTWILTQVLDLTAIAIASRFTWSREPSLDFETDPTEENTETVTMSDGGNLPSHKFLLAHRNASGSLEEMSVNTLIEQLREVPIVSPDFVSELVQGDPNLSTAQAAASYLTRKRLLTPYQQQLLCRGRGAELELKDYWILNRLGSGGAAVVLHARHKRFGLEYAIKVMAPDTQEQDRIARMRREMKASSELLHQNIVVVHETGECNGVSYIAMEWVNGRTLQSMVQNYGPLSVEESLDYTLQAARGLAFAHDSGFIHRDVKPGNLMVDRRGVLKVVDLGLVGFDQAEHAEDSKHGGIFGTIDYMSPEQAKDFSAVDKRSDIYSLGATLFYLLSGKPILKGKTDQQKLVNVIRGRGRRSISRSLPDIPDDVVALVREMTATKPDRRPGSMDEIVARLEAIVTENGIEVRRFVHVRVLIVEDDEFQCEQLRKVLRCSSTNFDLFFANRMDEAVEMLHRKNYDAALIDLMLPDSDGVSSVARVRAAKPTLPIVVLSGNEDQDLIGACIKAGADDYCAKKDLSPAALERHLLLALSRRQTGSN